MLSLAKAELSQDEREGRLIKFFRELAGEDGWPGLSKVLQSCGISASKLNREDYNLFMGRGFHAEVIKHARALYVDEQRGQQVRNRFSRQSCQSGTALSFVRNQQDPAGPGITGSQRVVQSSVDSAITLIQPMHLFFGC